MSKSSWVEISNDPEFKKLSPSEQAAVKRHYADTTLASDPDFIKMSAAERKAVRDAFLSTTNSDQKTKATIRDLPRNIAPSGARLAGNMWAAATHPWETAKGAAKLAGGTALNMLSPDVREMIVSDHPKLKGAVDTANAVGAAYADRYGLHPGSGVKGILDATAQTLYTDPVGFAADVSTLLAGAGGAVKGVATAATKAGATGAASAASKVARVADKAAAVTNPINYVSKPVGWVANKTGFAPAVGKAARNIADSHIIPENLNPLSGPVKPLAVGPTRVATNALAMKIAEKPVAVRNALRGGPHELVPGSPATAAQVIAPQMSATKLAAAGQRAEKLKSSEGLDIEKAQNFARLNDINDIGRNHTITPDQITRAGGGSIGGTMLDPATATIDELETALANADAYNYGISDPVRVTTDDRLFEILNLPHNSDVWDRATKLAAQKEQPFGIGTYVPASTAPSSVIGPNGQPIMITTPAQHMQLTGVDIHRIKKAFDALSYEKKGNGIYGDELAAIGDARNKFLDWAEDASRNPHYRIARGDSAAWKTLIARRRAAELFKDALTGSLSGEDIATQRANIFANLLDSPKNAVIKNSAVGKATDFNAYERWSDLLTPEDLAILERNKADLARRAAEEIQAKAGSDHRGLIDTGMSDTFFGDLPAQAHPITNWLMAGANNRVRENVANALLTPDAFERMLTEAIDREAKVNRYGAPFRFGGRVIQDINRFPAGYNALEYERENRKRNALTQ